MIRPRRWGLFFGYSKLYPVIAGISYNYIHFLKANFSLGCMLVNLTFPIFLTTPETRRLVTMMGQSLAVLMRSFKAKGIARFLFP